MTGTAVTLGLGLALAFAESGLGLGMLLPGETAVVVLAARLDAPTDLLLLGVAVAVGASLGDHVGYVLGRRHGDALRETRAVRRLGRHHLDRAMDLLHRRGAVAVLLTRLVPVVRTLTPAAAGAAGLEYRRFVVASLAGSGLWSATYVGGGRWDGRRGDRQRGRRRVRPCVMAAARAGGHRRAARAARPRRDRRPSRAGRPGHRIARARDRCPGPSTCPHVARVIR